MPARLEIDNNKRKRERFGLRFKSIEIENTIDVQLFQLMNTFLNCFIFFKLLYSLFVANVIAAVVIVVVAIYDLDLWLAFKFYLSDFH